MNQLGAVERRRRNLRILLFAIILGTLPLYCLGFLLWGTAPQQRPIRTETVTAQTTLATLQRTATNAGFASVTPISFNTLPPNVQPTSQPYIPPPVVTQYLPPTVIFNPPTATFYVFPTTTPAPTLTPFPTSTPLPTETLIPPPTETPIPSSTPSPTPTPTETGTGTATTIPFDSP